MSKLNYTHTFCTFPYINIVKARVLLTCTALKKDKKKIKKQPLRYIFKDFNARYNELLEKVNRPLMYINRLRRILAFVENNVLTGNVQCI